MAIGAIAGKIVTGGVKGFQGAAQKTGRAHPPDSTLEPVPALRRRPLKRSRPQVGDAAEEQRDRRHVRKLP